MKRKLYSIMAAATVFTAAFSLSLASPQTAFAKSGPVEINETNFPDDKFRTFVSGYDNNSDGILDQAELDAVTSIYYYESDTSFIGIEYFTNLRTLSIRGSQTGTLDVSDLDKLTRLNICQCEFTTVLVSPNAPFELLDLCTTDASHIDFSNYPDLETLYVNETGITSLDISTNTKITVLGVGGNHMAGVNYYGPGITFNYGSRNANTYTITVNDYEFKDADSYTYNLKSYDSSFDPSKVSDLTNGVTIDTATGIGTIPKDVDEFSYEYALEVDGGQTMLVTVTVEVNAEEPEENVPSPSFRDLDYDLPSRSDRVVTPSNSSSPAFAEVTSPKTGEQSSLPLMLASITAAFALASISVINKKA